MKTYTIRVMQESLLSPLYIATVEEVPWLKVLETSYEWAAYVAADAAARSDALDSIGIR